MVYHSKATLAEMVGLPKMFEKARFSQRLPKSTEDVKSHNRGLGLLMMIILPIKSDFRRCSTLFDFPEVTEDVSCRISRISEDCLLWEKTRFFRITRTFAKVTEGYRRCFFCQISRI